jgi:hypothetical protein
MGKGGVTQLKGNWQIIHTAHRQRNLKLNTCRREKVTIKYTKQPNNEVGTGETKFPEKHESKQAKNGCDKQNVPRMFKNEENRRMY